MIGNHIFPIIFRSKPIQPVVGLSNLRWQTTKTDIPELLQSKCLAVPLNTLLMILHFFRPKKMVPRVSHSVHARFTVIVGLLPVIVGLLGVGSRSVHARSTLAILGPWQLNTINSWWFQPWIPSDSIVRGDAGYQIMSNKLDIYCRLRKVLFLNVFALPAGLLRKFASM